MHMCTLYSCMPPLPPPSNLLLSRFVELFHSNPAYSQVTASLACGENKTTKEFAWDSHTLRGSRREGSLYFPTQNLQVIQEDQESTVAGQACAGCARKQRAAVQASLLVLVVRERESGGLIYILITITQMKRHPPDIGTPSSVCSRLQRSRLS